MSDAPDAELLEQFVRNHSDASFDELVERHIGLVYSTAFRKTGNPQQAEDIAQAVFIILARKADSLGAKTVLPGWLYHTARLTAANLQRAELRRIRREQEAFMQSTMNESAPEALWRELSPLLEDAMAGLGTSDRDAIVLRFFQNRSLAEVGAALGASEDAAKMRVNRALEKLRKFFNKRGVVSTTAVIAGVISSNSVHAASAVLAKTISTVAVAKGTVASASTLTLVKGGLKLMAWTKTKTTIVGVATVLLLGGTAVVTTQIIHTVRESYYPNIAGTWEAVGDQVDGLSAVNAVEDEDEPVQTHIVLRLFKTNGVYRATTDWPELGKKDVPMGDVVYDYPNLEIHPTVRDAWQLKVNAPATQMVWDHYIHFLQPDPVVFTRTTTPTPVPEPLTESDFVPATGSDLQGYWEGEIGTGKDAVPVDLKIARQTDGSWRAEGDSPMQGIQGRPVIVSFNPPLVQIKPADGAGMFSGHLNDSGTEISGSWTQGGQSITEIVRRVDYQAEHAHDADENYSFTSEKDLQGHWKGSWTVTIGTVKAPIRYALDIAKLPDGSYSATLTSLDQFGAEAPVPTSDFEYSPPDLHMEWKWAGETYDGRMKNGKIVGNWQQSGGGWPLVFEREY